MNAPPKTLTAQHRASLHRRTLITVLISQSFGGAGLTAGISVGALIAQDMLGSEALTGLPTALFTLGAALAAFIIGRITQRAGRRVALGFGFITGGIGAIGVVIATSLNNPALLFAALFFYGAGTATNMQTRYAGTDLAPEHRKATAVSIAMVATTIGAVAGPSLIEPMGVVAENFGLPTLSGPFLLAAAAYLLAGTILVTMLRPDPFLVAQQWEQQQRKAAKQPGNEPVDDTSGSPRLVRIGAIILVTSQAVMVGIMTMTPIHMRAHDHSMTAVGVVIGLHVAAMWLPSLITGLWVDKAGPRRTTMIAGLILLAAGLVGAFSPAESLTGITVALILLGVGWNIGLVSGTTLVVHGTQPATRAKTQGTIDVWYQIFGAAAGVLSGVLLNATGFATVTIVGGILALILLPAITLAPKQPEVSHKNITDHVKENTMSTENFDVTAEQAQELVAQRNAQFIDVRENDERAAAHIPGTTHIPMGEITARIAELDQSRPIVFQCRSGGRSTMVTQAFLGQGGWEAYNLEGGIMAWSAQEHPMEPAGAKVY